MSDQISSPLPPFTARFLLRSIEHTQQTPVTHQIPQLCDLGKYLCDTAEGTVCLQAPFRLPFPVSMEF